MIERPRWKTIDAFGIFGFLPGTELNIVINRNVMVKLAAFKIMPLTLSRIVRRSCFSGGASHYSFRQFVAKNYLATIGFGDSAKLAPEESTVWDAGPICLKLFWIIGKSSNAKIESWEHDR